MRRTLAAVAIGAAALLAWAAPAYAADRTTTTVHIVSTPDDGDPPWARDTIDRTTTISPGDTDGTWTVVMDDSGTFSTAGATATAEGATPVAKVTGTVTGHAEWTVTGTPLEHIATTPIDRSSAATKGTFTSKWAARFFEDGADVGPIRDWTWTYQTSCGEKRVETEQGATGDITGKTCAPPPAAPKDCEAYLYTGTKTNICDRFADASEATCKDVKWRVSLVDADVDPFGLDGSGGGSRGTVGVGCESNPLKPEPVASKSPAAQAAGGGGGSEPGLPVTGASTATAAGVGVGVVVVGAGLFFVFRRRKVRFTAPQ